MNSGINAEQLAKILETLTYRKREITIPVFNGDPNMFDQWRSLVEEEFKKPGYSEAEKAHYVLSVLEALVRTKMPNVLLRKWDSERMHEEKQMGVRFHLPVTFDKMLEQLHEALQISRRTESQSRREEPRRDTGLDADRRRQHTGQALNVSRTEWKNCIFCEKGHLSSNCSEANAMATSLKYNNARRKGACFRCLRPGHLRKDCKMVKGCSVCEGNHHDLLHYEVNVGKRGGAGPDRKSIDAVASGQIQSASGLVKPMKDPKELLMLSGVAKIESNSAMITARVLFDSGSGVSFISKRAAKTLGLKGSAVDGKFTLAGGKAMSLKTERVRFKLSTALPSWQGETFEVEAYVIDKPSADLTAVHVDLSKMPHLQNLQLADQFPRKDAVRVDIMLGVEDTLNIMMGLVIRGPPGTPVAQMSHIGWILAGPYSSKISRKTSPPGVYRVYFQIEDPIDMAVKHWELEHLEILPADTQSKKSGLEIEAMRLEKDPELAATYQDQICELLETGRAELVGKEDTKNPVCSMQTVHDHVKSQEKEFPDASNELMENMYVDDVISGASNVTSAKQLALDIKSMMKSRRFPLRKFASNKRGALDLLEREDLAACHEKTFVEEEYAIKNFGVRYILYEDGLMFPFYEKMENVKHETRRTVLQQLHRVYDPMGVLSPFVLKAKQIFQKASLTTGSWDGALPEDLAAAWLAWKADVEKRSKIKLRRPLVPENFKAPKFLLHAFGDACKVSYGAMVYLLVTDPEVKENHVTILCSKTRVSPIDKQRTLPELKLKAALITARLIEYVKTRLKLPLVSTYCWTDSNIVLHWISQPAYKWQWQGPEFLKEDEAEWPKQTELSTKTSYDEANRKLRRIIVCNVKSEADHDDPLTAYMGKFESYSKFLSVFTMIRGWLKRHRRKSFPNEGSDDALLNLTEYQNEEMFWINRVQRKAFPEEMRLLEAGKPVSKTSRLLPLSPVWDKKRETEAPPFLYVGTDFAGPLYVKTSRGDDTKKVYIVIFTCMTTRAVHLELVENMSAGEFLQAFERMTNRQGKCGVLYSDNAKSFKRAANVLELLYKAKKDKQKI
ncbi:PREDICTED: uncharacterized protein LOC106807552 [Priapulus caudatus]|uniref:Uncharacterized protein LOC106807552 n=1 Tax=Priapulus caudatus TaxID=37621 RepID=A0ABM1DZN1_PRICU|nr:PREDICTED: uncharacterized protein LOC106807552 [Priapulus caudatus]